MSWALTRPVSEVRTYLDRFGQALKDNNVAVRPIFATMRQTAVFPRTDDADPYLDALITKSGRFENLFKNLADVRDGFPEQVDLKRISTRSEFDRSTLRTNLMFGTPTEVIDKLITYDRMGVDHFIYNASYGLDIALQKQSLKLFIEEVMPAFNNGA